MEKNKFDWMKNLSYSSLCKEQYHANKQITHFKDKLEVCNDLLRQHRLIKSKKKADNKNPKSPRYRGDKRNGKRKY